MAGVGGQNAPFDGEFRVHPCSSRATCQCRHPITGAAPDYHWIGDPGDFRPRWRQALKSDPDPANWWFSVGEMAQQTGYSEYHLRKLLRDGKIDGRKPTEAEKSTWRIQGRAIAEFMKARGAR